MSERVEVEFADLKGSHTLTGVDCNSERLGDDSYGPVDAETLAFVLDGVTYLASEDPCDGYRSCMGCLERVDDVKVKNIFPPVAVVGVIDPNPSNSILEFRDKETGEIVLQIGTSEDDDYYPSCVLSFNPERMSINQ